MGSLTDQRTAQGRPWYREPFVWMVIGIPASAVIAGFVTLELAVSSDDGLVADDYYRRGLEINRTLARDNAAAAHGLTANLEWGTDARHLEVALAADTRFSYPAAVTVAFHHATRAGFDQTLVFPLTGEGRYGHDLAPLARGHWYLEIAADDWRVTRSVTIP